MTDIKSLMNLQPVKEVLVDFAATHGPSESADEFLERFGATTVFTAQLANSAGKFLGVRNTTRETFSISHPPAVACLASICAMFANGLRVGTVGERDGNDRFRVTGDVPSTRLHFAGYITLDTDPHGAASMVDVTIVVPGQIFVWGAGKRLMRKIRSDMVSAADRLAELPSVSDPLTD